MLTVILNGSITWLQYVGALCIVASIIVAKIEDLALGSNETIPITAVVLAIVASCNSVGAALYMEYLFKVSYKKAPSSSGLLFQKSDENFLNQQFWLYLYGAVVSTLGKRSKVKGYVLKS